MTISRVDLTVRPPWSKYDQLITLARHDPDRPDVFWGPMAYAVMGGLVVATLLTLVFLPALYVAWFRIRPAELANASTGESLEGGQDQLCGANQAAE